MATEIMKERNMADVKKSQRVVKIIVTTVIYIFLVLIAISVLFPFYWMLNSSLKSLEEYKLTVPTFFPRSLLFSNYVDAFTTANLGSLFINTLFVGLVSTALSLVITVLAAFAFSSVSFRLN